jgi:hypothetical protein
LSLFNRRLLFYDFECFAEDWLVVIIDYKTRRKKVIINDPEELKRIYSILKNEIFIGYNSRNYDQYIFKGILMGKDPTIINNRIILNGEKGYNVVKQGYKIPFNNFDIATGFHSLKQLEGFMGSMIKESSIPFDIKRKLTKEEIEETIRYCTHDVEETIEVFDNRREEFDSQLQLIEMFSLGMDKFNKTKAQLSAFILGAERQEDRNDEFNFRFPDTIILNKYKKVLDWYDDPKTRRYKDDDGKKMQLTAEVAGIPHIFGYGGVHAAIPHYVDEGIILTADVASLYPSLMIEYGFLSRNVSKPEKFKQIRDTRLELKAKKDSKHKPLKIVINGTFGASKDQFNNLYDPLMANNICIGGQLIILDLIEKVEPYCKLIQSNTDGIYMKVENDDTVKKIKEIAAKWEKRTRLNLEWHRYNKIYQKDVNNYVLIPDKLYDEKGKPQWKTKGAYVKQLKNIDYDLPIVNKALVNYFVKGIPLEETINKCDKLREFQKIVKVSSKYKYGMHGDKKLPEKVLRVFASNEKDAKGVFKVKTEERIEKIANTPDKCFIDNDDIKTKLIPSELDKNYYIEVAQKRLNGFLGIKNVRKKVAKKKTTKKEK